VSIIKNYIVDVSIVRHWTRNFKSSESDIAESLLNGRPLTATLENRIGTEAVIKHCSITTQQLYGAVVIVKPVAISIIKNLEYSKIFV
jgi:hypothetical protein